MSMAIHCGLSHWSLAKEHSTRKVQMGFTYQNQSEVFAVVKNKRHNMDQLIDQYDYVATILIELVFGNRTLIFAVGAKERGLSGMRIVTPSVMIPLTEMLEHALPKDFSDKPREKF
ncbi:hypothetical protein NECAME_12522 [Necator americanus]|uniref:Uncharacterized protein n=1 Tax=Necator americanus TaxID=51031 RepID=W2T0H3_NECAM|nr:hypothetical protein NECAME_12522 [Necator americanus]ETN75064.1 hypothetical protein NECAME_12522 [Necator americanus]